MANEIQVFKFDGREVRTVNIDGETYWVGKDVAKTLGYANTSDAISKHCKGVPKQHPLMTDGGKQEVRVISDLRQERITRRFYSKMRKTHQK